ncbi:beta family protein [Pseudomonas sp. FeS53a]|uniref:beta family protein n=1 Tax=Pseudomonas sp. FeS53a TaxID=1604022 RepID=UPI0009E51DF6|nr:beta family protein [Pseudomonas sp. FeS53a]
MSATLQERLIVIVIQMELMMFDHRHYVPVMKWRQGEYQALLKLDSSVKEKITPLFEIPTEEWDYENERPKKTLDEHIEKFGKRLKEKWGNRRCFVDSCYLVPTSTCADGAHHLSKLIELAESEGCAAVPVTGLRRHRDYQEAVSSLVTEFGRGICLRIKVEDYDSSDIKQDIQGLLDYLSLAPGDVDLVIDSGEYVPHSASVYANNLLGLMRSTPFINRWRTLSVSGTAFPAVVSAAEYRPLGEAIRYEWVGYKLLLKKLRDDERVPTFSDYTVSHPRTEKLDPRVLDPNAKIKYTIDEKWLIVVGTQVKRNGRGQYIDLCQRILQSGKFDNVGFSWGDDYIDGCANGTETTGGTSTWPSVTNNHHVTRVVSEISSLHVI